MDDIQVRLCSEDDTDTLATFNKQLIEDEQHDNTMTIEQLKERMVKFIHSDYRAYFFTLNENVIGYALVNVIQNPPYLRQFFVSRNHRRKGYGAIAFDKLISKLNTGTIDLEVLTWNHVGREFWKALGFEERSLYMRYNNKEDLKHDTNNG